MDFAGKLRPTPRPSEPDRLGQLPWPQNLQFYDIFVLNLPNIPTKMSNSWFDGTNFQCWNLQTTLHTQKCFECSHLRRGFAVIATLVGSCNGQYFVEQPRLPDYPVFPTALFLSYLTGFSCHVPTPILIDIISTEFTWDIKPVVMITRNQTGKSEDAPTIKLSTNFRCEYHTQVVRSTDIVFRIFLHTVFRVVRKILQQ